MRNLPTVQPFIFIAIWLLNISCLMTCFECPMNCNCSASGVYCNNRHLTEIPKNIPISTTKLDLSGNPGLKFSNDVFLQFTKLRVLYINNCSRPGPVLLPQGLVSLGLSNNRLTEEDIKETFHTAPRSLKSLNIANNYINLRLAFRFIPKWIQYLDSGGNILRRLRKDDLNQFSQMREINLHSCGLHEIETGAFDNLTHLNTMEMSFNRLTVLPTRLFQFNTNLQYLYLYANQLSSFPDLTGVRYLIILDLTNNSITTLDAKTFGIKIVRDLNVGYNHIKNFSLKGIKFLTIDLSHNNISVVADFAFPSVTKVKALYLQNNEITHIASKAFANLMFVSELHLQQNKIKSLPTNLFDGVKISKLILYNNHLSSMNGVLSPMPAAPEQIWLFSNPTLTLFKQEDFISMTNTSTVYVSCKDLKIIVGHKYFIATIKCFPVQEMDLIFSSAVGAMDGYHCIYNRTSMIFHCYPCKAGSYGVQGPRSWGECVQCPAGSFYQNEIAMNSCKLCPLGQYVPPWRSPGKRQSDCQICPKGTETSLIAGYRACKCLDGFARSSRFGECKKCNLMGISCKKDYPELNSGFWMTWNSTPNGIACKKIFKAFITNLLTKNANYDKNTVNFTCNLPVPHKCPMPGSCLGGADANCSKGYIGALCAVCDKGYSRHFNKCVKCESPVIAIVKFVGILIIFVLICILVSCTDKLLLSTQRQNGNEQEKRTFADMILSSLKILLGFYQVLSGIIHAFSYIKWPHNLKKAVSVYEYIQFEVLRFPSLRCIKPEWEMNAVTEFWFAISATGAVPALLLMYCFIRKSLITCKSYILNQHFHQSLSRKYTQHCLRAAALFLFATYPITSARIVKVLPISCHTFCAFMQNGNCLHKLSYVRSDYSIKCLTMSGENKWTLIAACIALVLPLGLPFLLLCLLWHYAPNNWKERTENQELVQHENILNIEEDTEYISAQILESARPAAMTEALRFSFENYTKSCWYWEAVEMIRKLLMTLGIVMFLEHTKIGLVSIIIIGLAFCFLHGQMKPIKDKYEHYFQCLSLFIAPLNLAIGAIWMSPQIRDEDIIEDRRDSFYLGILLVALNSSLIFLVLGRFTIAVVQKIRSALAKE